MTPELFAATWSAASLAKQAAALQAHVERAAQETHRSFVDGEAVAHAGLMRRYGPPAVEDAPLLALDSEARAGFDTTPDQQRFEAALRARVGLPEREELPRKLDGQWYDPRIGYPFFTDEKSAPLVGPNHPTGRCQRVEVKA